eukprot:SAG22_NODE_5784_length_953_cov_1.014052_3_plen_101_part_01
MPSDVDAVKDIINAIDAKRAEAGNPEDKERIFAAIRKGIAFAEMNKIVKKRLIRWTKDIKEEHVLRGLDPTQRFESCLTRATNSSENVITASSSDLRDIAA